MYSVPIYMGLYACTLSAPRGDLRIRETRWQENFPLNALFG
jgi:hypothetical protein